VFDFRYHALSLVAVFLALGIGIVLGASLGDSVVSEANRDVRSSLRGDVVEAREAERVAEAAAANRDDFINASFERLAGDSLRRRRVAIVGSGGLPQEIERPVRDAVEDAGGTIDSESEFEAQPDFEAWADELGGRYRRLTGRPAALRPLTRRLGRAIVRGGGVARRLDDAFPDDFAGDFRGADAVVFYRADAERDERAQIFEDALIDGLRATGVPVVGVEASSEDPSQIQFYEDAGLSSVDNVDHPGGRIALALALAGAEGSYGFKETADAPLPPARGR
jgi:hypothetical protein